LLQLFEALGGADEGPTVNDAAAVDDSGFRNTERNEEKSRDYRGLRLVPALAAQRIGSRTSIDWRHWDKIEQPLFRSLRQGDACESSRNSEHGDGMRSNAEYRGPARIPEVIPVFPLPARWCCLRGQIAAWHIFVAKAISPMVRRRRLARQPPTDGMIQPDVTHSPQRGKAGDVFAWMRRAPHPPS